MIHSVIGVGLTASQEECGGFIPCRHVDSIVKACVAISEFRVCTVERVLLKIIKVLEDKIKHGSEM